MSIHAVRDRDLTHAMPVERCADTLARSLSGRVVVAHAAWIELSLVNRALRTRGLRFTGPVLDTAVMARAAGNAPLAGAGEPALEALAMRLGLPVHAPHHAPGDALTTAQLMLALASRLEVTAPYTRDLTDLAPPYSSRRRGSDLGTMVT